MVSSKSNPHPPPPLNAYLDDHAALDEVIKGNSATASAVKLADEDVVESVRQAVAKAGEGRLELALVDGARAVAVVAAERGLPVGDVLPQRAKLLEVDGTSAVAIKHPNHEADRFRVESCPCACSRRGAGGGYDGVSMHNWVDIQSQ